ncbi:hypothetical protein [Nioella nitratireducens]|uniref:hypothetical protein n=1 Tax=Nioella nitratireducens TaxID=1287720 RepID=UPI0008FD935F|nr:hypothetical protein [Nioella nitratireducens]
MAQSFSSPGQNWSASWGFNSASDRSVRLQEAQAIRSAEQQGPTGPSTVVYNTTTNDYRSNYQDLSAISGTLGPVDFHIGDEIGQNTNSVGAMNTGQTTIEVHGDSNLIDATNSADSAGCVDGSVVNDTLSLSDNLTQGSSNLGGLTLGQSGNCQ